LINPPAAQPGPNAPLAGTTSGKTRRAMGTRLMLGPVMIVGVVAGLGLDQWLQDKPLPFRVGHLDSVPPGVLVFLFLATLCIIAAREISALLIAENILGSKRMATFAACAGLVVSCAVPAAQSVTNAVAWVATTAVAVLVLAMAFYSRKRTVEGVIAATGGVLLSFVYLGLMGGFVLAIRREHPAWVLLWVLLVTKSCDIGAYFTGHAVGRHKLIPWLSPGKTWEGLIGGVLTSAGIAAAGLWALRRFAGEDTPPWYHGLIIGALLGVAGQVGDLLESLLKRDAGKKDSGATVPGFGGILDVLDSVLLAAPVAFWWLQLMEARGYFSGPS